EGAELAYLHGYGAIFPKVEAALEGQDVGFATSITLDPEDAFGEYDAELLRVEPRERFPAEVEIGMRFEGVPGDREEEALIYTVPDVTADAVVVDGNHPLAGERLWFRCAVKDVRRATPDEISHGHAHGDLGIEPH
ncbi:MAG TPA: peptidylprolyl isomerase, partial [Usitatibacter sp.]|nr:peptidylprolyl isomerase [Usitatibacter sp.]